MRCLVDVLGPTKVALKATGEGKVGRSRVGAVSKKC